MMVHSYPSIPDPMLTLASHQDVLMAMKLALEILGRHRGDPEDSAALLKEVTPKLNDAPHDGKKYVRQDGAWVEIP